MTSNIDARRRDARKLKKLIEEDRKKDVFEIISDKGAAAESSPHPQKLSEV